MSDEKEQNENTQGKPGGASNNEVALELMRFIAHTTGYGKTATGAGFAGKAGKTQDEQVDALLALYGRCRAAVDKK
jgi:hypothetical protein